MADHEARYMSPNDVLMVYIMNKKGDNFGIKLLALSHSSYRGKRTGIRLSEWWCFYKSHKIFIFSCFKPLTTQNT